MTVATLPEYIVCDSCNEGKLPDFFLEMTSELDPQAPSPQVCDHCRKFGPPVPDPCAPLTGQWRTAIMILAGRGSQTDAAEASGLSRSSIRTMLKGSDNADVRAAYQRLLIDVGMHGAKMAQIVAEAGDANQLKWHPTEKEFIETPDHNVRLNAVRTAMKAQGLEAPKEKAGDLPSSAVQVVINTNLGSKDPVKQAGTYTVVADTDDG